MFFPAPSSLARAALLVFALGAAACEDALFRIENPDASAPRDSGPAADAQSSDAEEADGTELDAGFADAGLVPDGGESDAGFTDSGVGPACDFATFGAEDRERVVLLGYSFSATPGMPGTEVGTLRLAPDGTLTLGTARVDIGERPARIEVVPSGEIALVLGEDNLLVSVRIDGPDSLTILDQVQLPSAEGADLRILDDGQTVIVAGLNVAESAGLSTVHLGCDGQLTVEESAFYNLRLTESFVLLPGQTRAVVLGGQTVFDPVDPDDVRLLERTPTGWRQVNAFNLWMDFIGAGRIALSPNGTTVMIPNNSLFSAETAQVMVAEVAGDSITEAQRLMNMDDASEILFSPDGTTALVSLVEPGRIVVLTRGANGWAEVTRIRGIGLPDQMALVSRGRLSGRVLIPSVDPNGGPNVAQLEIRGTGVVADLGQLELGAGSESIAVAIGVQP